jgi:3-methyl-2-oxobutanoate hydroxymethyltransferase
MPYQSPGAATPQRPSVPVTSLSAMRARSEPIAMLTAYDASFAVLADRAGVDVILVGDSLGMVCQGRKSTLSVKLAEIVYHSECVLRGLEAQAAAAMVIADMPFGTYHVSVERNDMGFANDIGPEHVSSPMPCH